MPSNSDKSDKAAKKPATKVAKSPKAPPIASSYQRAKASCRGRRLPRINWQGNADTLMLP